MFRANTLALLLSLAAILLSAWVSLGVYEGLAQLEDEYTYQWQAQVIAQGDFVIPSPPNAAEFLVPFVVDHQGMRFGKYPLGWPVVLSLGVRVGLIRWVNPLLAGLAVWLTYRLGQKLLGDKVGLIAAGLTTFSPFFLTYSGSLLAHTWGLVLSLGLGLAWIDLTDERDSPWGWLPTLVAGSTLGVLALSRPWTALGVAIPFGLHGLFKMGRGSRILRKRIVAVGVITLFLGSIHFLWQYVLTGDPLQNPYTLWWPYDRVGFGAGIGVAPDGHTLQQAWMNSKWSLTLFTWDIFGWQWLTWPLVLVGVWAARRRANVWVIGSVFWSLVGVYLLYWVSGPRYFYEGLPGQMVWAAAGVAWLAGWHYTPTLAGRITRPQVERIETRALRFIKIREIVVPAGLVILMGITAIFYTPERLAYLKSLYGFSQAELAPFETPEAQRLAPALVLVHTNDWKAYGSFIQMEDPYLSSDFIFAFSRAGEDELDWQLARHFPNRNLIHYYPDEPGVFYVSPRP